MTCYVSCFCGSEIWEGLRWLVFLLHVASAGVNHLAIFSWQWARLKGPRMYSYICCLDAPPCVLSLYTVFRRPVWSSLQHGSLFFPQRKEKWKLPGLLKASPGMGTLPPFLCFIGQSKSQDQPRLKGRWAESMAAIAGNCVVPKLTGVGGPGCFS